MSHARYLTTALFRLDRLTLDALHCELIGEPFGWRRGPAGAASKSVLVIENAATWHSYSRWNAERELFSAVVYGKGFQSAASVRYLAEVFSELGGVRRVVYFGDLDPPGLQIPQQASAYAGAHGLPKIQPHLWSYRQLLSLSADKATTWDGEPATHQDCEWLGELADEAWTVLSVGRRMAQERIEWEFLTATPDSSDAGV